MRKSEKIIDAKIFINNKELFLRVGLEGETLRMLYKLASPHYCFSWKINNTLPCNLILPTLEDIVRSATSEENF